MGNVIPVWRKLGVSIEVLRISYGDTVVDGPPKCVLLHHVHNDELRSRGIAFR